MGIKISYTYSRNSDNVRRTWRIFLGPRIRSSTNTPNYIREAKIRPVKNQLYSSNTPIYIREQMLAQLETAFRGK